MRRARVALAGCACCIVAVLAGPAGAAERLRVADTPTLLTGLVTLAKVQGHFAAEGLDVTLASHPTGDEAIRAMQAGQADVAISAETAFVLEAYRTRDLRVVTLLGSWDNEVRILARRDRRIAAPLDLRGKRVGTQSHLSTHFFLDMFLAKHTLAPREITTVFAKGPELPGLLAAGQIDAFSHREPFLSQAKARLDGGALEFTAPGLYRKTFMVLVRQALLAQQPLVVTRLLKGLIRAERGAKAAPAEARRVLGEALKVPLTNLETAWPEVDLRVSLDQHFLMTVEDIGRWVIRNRLVDTAHPINFLDYVAREPLTALRPHLVTLVR